MKISDSERSEVAENLRLLTYGHSIRYKEQFFDELAETVVGFDDYHDFNVVLDKLADLIDPTCRNVSGYKDTFECSECRCKVELITEVCNEYGEPFHVPFVPSYCPNCRARVVSGDGN